jgi:hypothetical protein
MIQFITRKTVLENNASIAFEISTLQKAMFNDDNDSFENEDDKTHYHNLFDCKDQETKNIDRIYKVFSINHTDIKTFTNVIYGKLAILLSAVLVKKLFVIAHLKMNLFGANLQHKYAPAKMAFQQLENITQSWNYNEAFIIDMEDFPTFIEIFF